MEYKEKVNSLGSITYFRRQSFTFRSSYGLAVVTAVMAERASNLVPAGFPGHAHYRPWCGGGPSRSGFLHYPSYGGIGAQLAVNYSTSRLQTSENSVRNSRSLLQSPLRCLLSGGHGSHRRENQGLLNLANRVGPRYRAGRAADKVLGAGQTNGSRRRMAWRRSLSYLAPRWVAAMSLPPNWRVTPSWAFRRQPIGWRFGACPDGWAIGAGRVERLGLILREATHLPGHPICRSSPFQIRLTIRHRLATLC